MTKSASPLRYPGGKASIFEMVSDIIYANSLEGCAYAEPFAGGSGLALSLLFEGVVREIYLNDIDHGIAAFWRAVLDQPDELCSLIEGTPITLEEWHRQKAVFNDPSNLKDDLKLGFSALFLNRTNRSGIIKGAGVIGGLSQKGNYLIDCRFNKSNIIKRIRRISKYKSRIFFTQQDAIDFIERISKDISENSFICSDPPYYQKGSKLYTSYYAEGDHAKLAKAILSLKQPWITTYDHCDAIKSTYAARRQYGFNVQYSAQIKRLGSELLIASKGLRLPNTLPICKIHQPRSQEII